MDTALDRVLLDFAKSQGFKLVSDQPTPTLINKFMKDFEMSRDEAVLYHSEMVRDEIEKFLVGKFGPRR